jgi:hypothetical protein
MTTPNTDRGLGKGDLTWLRATLDARRLDIRTANSGIASMQNERIDRILQALASIPSPEEGVGPRAVRRLLSGNTAAVEDDLTTTTDYLARLRARNTKRVVTVWKDGTWREWGLPDAEIAATEPDHLIDIPLAEPAPATLPEREAAIHRRTSAGMDYEAAVHSLNAEREAAAALIASFMEAGRMWTDVELADAILSLLQNRLGIGSVAPLASPSVASREPEPGPATPSEGALEALRNHQQQLDQDGVMVGVSRQALDECLAAFAPELTADFTRSLPGGKLDDSEYEAVESALDKAEATMLNDSRWLTLAERVDALGAEKVALLTALKACRTNIAGYNLRDGGEARQLVDEFFNELQRIHQVAVAAITKAEKSS